MSVLSPSSKKLRLRFEVRPGVMVAALLNLFLLSAIGYDLIRIYHFENGTDRAIKPESTAVAAVPPVAQEKTAGWVGWLPFGNVQVAKGPAPPPPIVLEDAPDTQLNVTLTGILSIGDGPSWVVVQSGTDGEKVLGLGDRIAGDAKIVSVRPDRIILEKNGRFETLRMPKTLLPLDVGISGAKEKGLTVAQQLLQQLREQFLVQPDEVFKKFLVTPVVKEGVFGGYAIQPGSESGLLEKLGMQPGDVITMVNGVALNTPLKGMEALGSLGQSQSLQLSLLRNGKVVTIHHAIRP
ncbi:MAG: hypothetical protein HQL94_01215 [Magnetococcales bacterium]|nr:hypothetical protein [Magnetococcales bacterium]MBF0437627.1 hypothetical protein [Magnetococcales bacterium]